MDRQEALARRVAAQQLDRPPAPRPFTDAAVLDLGVQDTGRDGASWALVNRGVPVESPAALAQSPDLALVWTPARCAALLPARGPARRARRDRRRTATPTPAGAPSTRTGR